MRPFSTSSGNDSGVAQDNLAAAGSPLPPQARATLTATLPTLLPRVRETMRDEIARSLKGLRQDDSSQMPFFVKALGVRQMADVNEHGDAADVKLDAGGREIVFPVGPRTASFRDPAGHMWEISA